MKLKVYAFCDDTDDGMALKVFLSEEALNAHVRAWVAKRWPSDWDAMPEDTDAAWDKIREREVDGFATEEIELEVDLGELARQNREPLGMAYIEAARERWHRDGEIEIDDQPIVSEGGDPGAYVSAWVWVDQGAAGFNKLPGGHWDENPFHPLEDWRHEVGSGDTMLGYRDWVRARIEGDGYEVEEPEEIVA